MYIGFVEKKGFEPKVFFNFKPIAEVKNQQLISLTSEDLDELLPESEKRNINFDFSWNDTEARRQINAMFDEKTLIVFEFVSDDLQKNFKNNGERNQTGYKVRVVDLISSGKIRRLDTIGVYYAVRKNELLSDFSNDAIVEIAPACVLAGDRVLVELDEFWAGPYEVGYSDYTFYIKPLIKENKYAVNGYNKNDVQLRDLTSFDGHWNTSESKWVVAVPKKDASVKQIDVISEEVLLGSFCDSLKNGVPNSHKVDFDDIPALLQRYEGSVLSGSGLTADVRKSRLNRLLEILTSEEDVDNTLDTVSNFICDLLIRYQDSPNVEKWLQTLLEKHPDLIEKLKDVQAISDRIAQLEQELTDMQQHRSELENTLAEKQAAVAEINEAAIKASKEEILRMSEEHTKLADKIAEDKGKLTTLKKELDLVDSIEDIQKKVNDLQGHHNYLSGATASLEAEFQQLISRTREKMVGIAFDGFMASKMLHAAAQWEAEQATEQYKELVSAINDIPADNKAPDELIDYLCRTVHIVRPTYSKNTIINIAICITQGFLTVFSGEPGCGKTSICNIFGEVLGLNKIAQAIGHSQDSYNTGKRYISVSVERGWTSKRDFIGYYNPLSKTFDKSNRRVYDALCMLDEEKRNGTSRFPLVVLLDEANLSPMEYYWSDFMNICDDLGSQSEINLGEDHVFSIPETLHFVATINNDHTTETLSPRLIDRAWIILLPQQHNVYLTDNEVPSSNIEIITWASLYNTFIPKKEECILSAEVQKIYDLLLVKLREKRFFVSPRIDKAIKRYWVTATKYFEEDETKTSAEIVALDYAVAQRILPKIMGNGDTFEKWLDEFRALCSNHELNMSAKILKDIIERGNQKMKYYEFFY